MLRNTLFILLFFSTSAMATPASDGSIKQLLTVTKAQRLLNSMHAQVNALMDNSIRMELKGKQPTAKQQKAIKHMKTQMIAILQQGMSWKKLEPVYIRLYKDSFTEEEIKGMLAFYKTAAGQAVINKMPLLMRKTMVEIQQMSAGMAPQMQKVQQEFASEMAAANK